MITSLLGYNACATAEMKKETITVSASQLNNGYIYNLGYAPRFIYMQGTRSTDGWNNYNWSVDGGYTFFGAVGGKVINSSEYFERTSTGIKLLNWGAYDFTIEIWSIK